MQNRGRTGAILPMALLAAAPVAFITGATGVGVVAQPERASTFQPTPPQVVLSTMHQVNQLEMRLGKLAEEKSTSEVVRRYGDRLYRDHRFGDRKVVSLARAEGLDLLAPDKLPAAPKLQPITMEAQRLDQEAGSAFDRTFLQVMVRSHELATGMLREALTGLPPGKVRELVSRLLPILEQHLELARAIQSERAPE